MKHQTQTKSDATAARVVTSTARRMKRTRPAADAQVKPQAKLRRTGMIEQLKRLTRYRLIVPVLRGSRDPRHTARGVMVGLFWALTPTVGIQMLLVFVTWITSRNFFSYHFNLPIGLAWTWVTNPATLIPSYYVFYVTGQMFLGHWGEIGGYEAFGRSMQALQSTEEGFVVMLGNWFSSLITEFGFPILVGSIPWAIFGSFVGYKLTHLFVSRHRDRRLERFQKKTDEG